MTAETHRISFVERQFKWLMLAPALIVIISLMIFPLLYTIYMSMQDWDLAMGGRFVGLENFAQLTRDSRFISAVGRMFAFASLAVTIQTVLGVAIALAFNRDFVGKGLVRTLFLFPMVATPVAIALVWVTLYNPVLGVVRLVWEVFGSRPPQFLGDQNLVLLALVIVDTWQWTPLITLMTLAGLSTLPHEPFEAAEIDGASRPQVLRFLTLPMLRPVIVVAMLFRAIDALKTFDIIQVMTGGGPAEASETLNVYIFLSGFQYFKLGYASSMLLILFIIVMSVSVILIRLRRAAE